MSALTDIVPDALRGADDTRVRATLRGIVPVAVLLLAGHAIAPVTNRLRTSIAGETASLGEATFSMLVVLPTVVVPAAVALVVSRRLDHRPYAAYGFRPSRTWIEDLLGGLGIGALSIAVVTVYLMARGYVSVTTTTPAAPENTGALLGYLGVAVLYIAANVLTEELLFRGVVLQNFAEGLAARSVEPRRLAVCAVVVSALVFGVWHPLSPGQGGGVAFVLTSAGLGVLLGVAYLLTGTLSLPIGIHIGGGLALQTLYQRPFVGGYTFPTLVEASFLSRGPELVYGLLFVRVLSGLLLAVLWVALTREEVSLAERVLRWDGVRESERGGHRERPTTGDD